MDIRQLEYFVQIAIHGGFNRASAHLHIAQSALSRHVRQLEDELGVTLFERGGRGVQLTPAGEVLAARAENLLRQFRQTRDEIVAQSDLPRGELAVGLPPSLQKTIAAPLLNEFSKLYPDVFVNVWMGTSIELREWILSGKLDLAVFGALEPETVLESHPGFRDQVYVVAPPSVDFGKTVIDMEELSRLPMILTSKPNSMRLLVEHAATRRNLKLDVLMEVNSIPLLIDMVAMGAGYSALPYSGICDLIEEGRLAAARVRNLSYNWIIGNSRERPLSAAGRRMRELLSKRMEPYQPLYGGGVAAPAARAVEA